MAPWEEKDGSLFARRQEQIGECRRARPRGMCGFLCAMVTGAGVHSVAPLPSRPGARLLEATVSRGSRRCFGSAVSPDAFRHFSPWLQIVWDEKKNRWVDVNEPEEEVSENCSRLPHWPRLPMPSPRLWVRRRVSEPAFPPQKKAPPPPPTSLPKAPLTAPPGPGGPPRASVNMFSRKAGNSQARD